jgi:acyl carrier protein
MHVEGAPEIEIAIRRVIRDHARLAVETEAVAGDDDLYRLGLSSHAAVNVMLALEVAFEIEFPERMLGRTTFESITSMRAAIEELLAG